MIHPYLTEPVRAAAFAYLSAHPCASEVRWAKALGWTPSKVHRFIVQLIKLGLAEVSRTQFGSTFHPLIDPERNRSESDVKPKRNRSETEAPHLEASRSRSLVPRCEKLPANGGNAEAMMCIAIVNEVLGANFKDSYDPILSDNYGSQRAVEKWMAAGMSLADMVKLLRAKAAVFNPSRSGGKLPGSLGYFTRWMLSEWAIERRQIPLPLMTVTHQSKRPRMEKPVAIGEVMAGLERKAR